MKRMVRSFLPVGQGAFYSEKIVFEEKPLNIVYDCGSLPSQKICERRIKEAFGEKEVIDAVFISHFDNDHINGLPFLLKYCNVRNVFFPLLTTQDKIYSMLKHKVLGEEETIDLFQNNPLGSIEGYNGETRLFYVAPVNWDVDEGQSTNDRRINSGEDVFSRVAGKTCVDWELIPFNFRQSDRVKLFEKALIDQFGYLPSKQDLIDDYKRNIQRIKVAFNEVPECFNTNSMTLYSGINNPLNACWQEDLCTCPGGYNHRYWLCRRRYPIGCLYTGDYDASEQEKWEDLTNAYKDQWDTIGCFQVPHHGSSHNYSPDISLLDACFVISAGTNNRYGHPHAMVIRDLLLKGKNVHWVTEDSGSQFHLAGHY